MRIFVTQKDIEDAQKEAQEKIRARNKAMALIEDAKARYVKEKTRARSKKAALEKDALLSSPKFKDLELYEKRQDIDLTALPWRKVTDWKLSGMRGRRSGTMSMMDFTRTM